MKLNFPIFQIQIIWVDHIKIHFLYVDSGKGVSEKISDVYYWRCVRLKRIENRYSELTFLEAPVSPLIHIEYFFQ